MFEAYRQPLPICFHYNDVIWASWRLRLPATRLFVHDNNKGNSKAPHHCPFVREIWISRTKDHWCRKSYHDMTSSCLQFRRLVFQFIKLYHHVLTLTMAVILGPSVTVAGQNVLCIGHVTTMALQTYRTEWRHVRFHVVVLTVSNSRRRPAIDAWDNVTKS